MPRLFERGFYFGAGRVDHTDKTGKNEVLFKLICLDLFGIGSDILFHTIRQAKDS